MRPDGAWRAVPPVVKVHSAVGAGDSFLAGLCAKLAEQESPGEALRFGVACGTATAMNPGTSLCQLEGVNALLRLVRLEPLSVGV